MNIKTRFVRIGNFIYTHRAKLAAGATAAAFIWLMVKNAQQWNEFLREHNLYDTYYMTDAFDDYV
jgi:hypothetical protein